MSYKINFTCQICFNGFDDSQHVPKVLGKCGHTICLTCLQTLIITTRQRNNGFKRWFLKCPFDFQDHLISDDTTVEDFPKNFVLADLIQEKLKKGYLSVLHSRKNIDIGSVKNTKKFEISLEDIPEIRNFKKFKEEEKDELINKKTKVDTFDLFIPNKEVCYEENNLSFSESSVEKYIKNKKITNSKNLSIPILTKDIKIKKFYPKNKIKEKYKKNKVFLKKKRFDQNLNKLIEDKKYMIQNKKYQVNKTKSVNEINTISKSPRISIISKKRKKKKMTEQKNKKFKDLFKELTSIKKKKRKFLHINTTKKK